MPPKRLRPLAPADDKPGKRPRDSLDTSCAEKPYSCDQCRLPYKKSSTLRRHKREKHGKVAPFLCEHCGDPFQRPEGVKNHIGRRICHERIREQRLPYTSQTLNHRSPCSWVPTPTEFGPFIDGGLDYANERAGLDLRRAEFERAGLLDFERTEFDLLTLGTSLLDTTYYPIEPPMLNTWRKLARREKPPKNGKQRCTRRRPPSSPFPPAFDYPPPQDLEDLLLRQNRSRRRLRVMESFNSTHSKFIGDPHTDLVPPEARNSQIRCHRTNPKQAWKDEVAAVQELLSGVLPRELHSVLGVAQVAGAVRSALDDIDSPAASEDKFLCDLSRWRQVLRGDSQAAFDYYADLLWDNRPPSDLAWNEFHDAETLVHFQDLLRELLSHVGLSLSERAAFASALTPSTIVACPPTAATLPMSPSLPMHEETPCKAKDAVTVAHQNDTKEIAHAEVALYLAGAIFALILAYILLYTGHFSVQILCLCFITTESPSHDHRDRLRWLQHASLLANCRLLELLIQQLGMDRVLLAETPSHQLPPTTMLGSLGWHQLIARCFEDTTEANSVTSNV